MTRALAVLLVLAGCSGPVPPQFPPCPGPVPAPARLHTHEGVGTLEIRVEVAREAESKRANACAASVEAMRKWIHDNR